MPTNKINWSVVLTPATIDEVAECVRQRLLGNYFVIAKALYCDSKETELEVVQGCMVDSLWTDEPREEPVRVFREEGKSPWFGFSAGGTFWSFEARPDNKQEHEDFYYPRFQFERCGFTVTERAPGGHLHKRVFAATDIASILADESPDTPRHFRVDRKAGKVIAACGAIDPAITITNVNLTTCPGCMDSMRLPAREEVAHAT